MPVFEQGYRPYVGPVRAGSRALAIAWESVRPRMRWFVWLFAALFSFWPYVVFAVLIYIVTMTDAIPVGRATRAPTMAFEGLGNINPTRVLGFLNADSTGFYWEVLSTAAMSGGFIILPAIACAGILAADRRTGALQIYLARPVTRGDYVLGKLLATAAFPALVTAVPTLLLWIESVMFHTDGSYVLKTWTAPLAIVVSSVVYALWASSVVMALSSVLSRPVVAGIAAVFVHLFLSGLAGALTHAFADKTWRLLSPGYALGGFTAPCFGLSLPEWLPIGGCLVHAVVVPALCLLLVVRRVRAVEVAT